MKAEQVAASFRKRLGRKVKNVRIEKKVQHAGGKHGFSRLWLEVDAGDLKAAVKHLFTFQEFPHFSVCSGCDAGGRIELTYHFTLNYGESLGELAVSMRVAVPKGKPEVPTITGMIPGALVSEREIQEMLGVTVRGIPDSRRLFLHGGFPKGVHPWRKDGAGPGKLVRDLNEEGRK